MRLVFETSGNRAVPSPSQIKGEGEAEAPARGSRGLNNGRRKAYFGSSEHRRGRPARIARFLSRLGVSLTEPPKNKAGEFFHANGDVEGGLHLDLDSSAFAQVWNKGWSGRPDLVGRVVLGFRVSSRPAVDRVYAELTGAGHRGLQPPYDAFWGARYAVVEDPNGIAVGLMSLSIPIGKLGPQKDGPAERGPQSGVDRLNPRQDVYPSRLLRNRVQ